MVPCWVLIGIKVGRDLINSFHSAEHAFGMKKLRRKGKKRDALQNASTTKERKEVEVGVWDTMDR